MLKVGLTGGLGSGKSTASRFFKSLGAYVLDADATAKTLLDNNEDKKADVMAFDYDQDGTWDKFENIS